MAAVPLKKEPRLRQILSGVYAAEHCFGSWVFHRSWAFLTFARADSWVNGGLRDMMDISGWRRRYTGGVKRIKVYCVLYAAAFL